MTASREPPARSGRGEPRLGVFVVGMHRGGTSAITRLVNLLGVPTGTEVGSPGTELEFAL